jgi:predicted methyltransferase
MLSHSLKIATVACAVLAAPLLQAADPKPSAAILAAVADSSRPPADTERDANRKPAEVIAFAGIKPGDQVVELLPGGGYFTRIFSKVVGDKGSVLALVPARNPNAPANAPDPAARVNAIAASPGYGNLKIGTLDPTAKQDGKADIVWTSLNYHDLHNRPGADLTPYNKMAFDALKSGGVYIVIDHAARPGADASEMAKLHRIDAELVKGEVLSVGFKLDGESKVLANPADDHTAEVHGTIRGTTDQFTLKFRKP